MTLKFKFLDKEAVLKEFTIDASPLEDLSNYRKVLKSFHKDVNDYLTSLVSKESESVNPEHKEYLSESEPEEEKSPKRALSKDPGSDKVKVKKR